MVKSISDIPWLRNDSDRWKDFSKRHETWVRARAKDGVTLCLPWDALGAALRLYKLDESEEAAEVEFAELCRQWQAIGYGCASPIRYSPLLEPAPMPTIGKKQAEELLELGWERDDIESYNANRLPHKRLLYRWTSATGRLLSREDFLAERDSVRSIWQSIPFSVSPDLPLTLPASLSRRIKLGNVRIVPVPAAQQEFWREFLLFCERWQIIEMATWDLPLPQGPRSSGLPLGRCREGTVEFHTPWHFPLEKSDGQGDAVYAAHADQCRVYGVDDHESWETYASLLTVSHWQTVCAERYPKARRVSDFSFRLDQLLAEVLSMSEERVKKLRSLLRSLQSGSRTSLKGYR